MQSLVTLFHNSLGRLAKRVTSASLLAVTVLAMLLSAADLTGKWDAKVETPAGSGNPTFTFKQTGETLTGTYSGQLGESPLTGTVKGNEISFSFEVAPQGDKLKVLYTGKVQADGKLAGKLEIPGLAEGTWTAERLR